MCNTQERFGCVERDRDSEIYENEYFSCYIETNFCFDFQVPMWQ